MSGQTDARQLGMVFPSESAEGMKATNQGERSRGGGFSDDHPGVGILCAIFQHGVDRTRALAILEHFGSVSAFQQATLKERMQVPGIGRTLAKRFDHNMELPYCH